MKKVILIILIALFVKLVYFAFAIILSKYSENKTEVSVNYKSFKSIFHQNDSFWYEKIAKEGYPKLTNKNAIGFSYKEVYVQSSWAFFPFYPGLNAAIMKITRCDYSDSALFLSIVFSILAFIGFYKFNNVLLQDEQQAFFNTLLFITLPFNYYFSVFYTEALFFTFLIYCFLAIYYHKDWLLFFLLIPLTLLRPNGLVLSLPLFLYYLERHNLIKGYKIDFKTFFAGKYPTVVIYFSSALICFVLYGLYQKQMAGEFFAFSIAQKGWYREFLFPVLAFFRRGDFATQFNSFYTIVVILFSVFVWKRFSFSFNVFIWISLIFPMCSGSMTSMQRFITIIFPLVICLGELIFHSRFKTIILIGCFSIQIVLFGFWLRGSPFSF